MTGSGAASGGGPVIAAPAGGAGARGAARPGAPGTEVLLRQAAKLAEVARSRARLAPFLGITTDSSSDRGITGPPGAAGTGDIGAATCGTGAMGAGATGAGGHGRWSHRRGAGAPGNGDMGPAAPRNAGAGITIDRSLGGARFGPPVIEVRQPSEVR